MADPIAADFALPAGFRLPAEWPAPADPAQAGRLIERFTERGAAEAALAAQPEATAMLRALGGGSSYLADLCVRDAPVVRDLAMRGPDAVVADALAAVRALPPATDRKRLAAALRQAKRAVALATAIADIGGIWDLAKVTASLSDLAEATLGRAVAHLLRAGHDSGDLRLPDPEDPVAGCGFVALGMGKLGARELNYSSDIDLVLLYDQATGIYRADPDLAAGWFSRLARNLVALMEARDADGYVFRTDLRLRPDPAATPPAVSVAAAIDYYESMGQNWERAAMLKARPVAGDLAMGAAFLDAIRPFIWRRGLDFAAVADLHAMKRKIDAHKGTALPVAVDPAARIAGHDVKLGEGGIREIEFLAQTLQLVWGGRDPHLRSPVTLQALADLAEAGRLDPKAAAELAADYTLLRRVEHRLQMVADHQVHALPAQADELAKFAVFMGYPDATALGTVLGETFARVRRHYADVVAHIPAPPADAGPPLDFRGDGRPEETVTALTEMGFEEPDHVVAGVRSWLAGRLRALRSSRARELLAQMLPSVLAALARQPNPDVAFNRFDMFLARQPAGVQILSLFQRNPALLGRIVAVLGAAPSLAEHLASYPNALEGLLSPDETPDYEAILEPRLTDARMLEDTIAIVRRLVREEDFSLSVATMEGRTAPLAAAEARSRLLDAALEALVPRVMADFAERNGAVEGGEMGIVLLGRAGARRMMAGSDLDLMLIYDHDADAPDKTASRRMPPAQWFVRAAHAVVAALTARGADGPLYEVDMRLRPSGNKGPVAVALSAFRRYHAEDAWTWERMALTQARVVAAPPRLREAIEMAIADAIRDAVAAAGDAARVRANAALMRARMDRELPPHGALDVKLRPGGMVDIEFITQIRRLTGEKPPPEAALLRDAWSLFFTVATMLRILIGRRPPEFLPDASAEALLRVVGRNTTGIALPDPLDVPGLLASLDAVAASVRAVFDRFMQRRDE
jgi:[glutamine synthetase] adenylyltransferase / [glutamine synthetase]-adenylyl-L-tyrosine phosphorylase